MKKPTIEEVREYFKNAETVKCWSDGDIYEYDNESPIIMDAYDSIYLKFARDCSDGLFDSCCIWRKEKGYSEIISLKEKTRYWFVVFNYSTARGFGNGNLGVGAVGFDLKGINEQAYKQSPEALPNSVVITNFIEMTEKEYNEFWENKN